MHAGGRIRMRICYQLLYYPTTESNIMCDITSYVHPVLLCALCSGVIGGSPCPVEVMRQVIDRMHMPNITVSLSLLPLVPPLTV